MHFENGVVYLVQCSEENYAHERALATFLLARQQTTQMLFSQNSRDQIDELTDLLPSFSMVPCDALTVSTFPIRKQGSASHFETITSDSNVSIILIGDWEELSETDRLNLKNIATSNSKPILVFQAIDEQENGVSNPLGVDCTFDVIELLRSSIKGVPNFLDEQKVFERNTELHILLFELWLETIVASRFPEITSLKNCLAHTHENGNAPIVLPGLANVRSEAELACLIADREPTPLTLLLTANYLRVRRARSPNQLDHKVLQGLSKTLAALKLMPLSSHLLVDALFFPKIPISAQYRSTTRWCKLIRYIKRKVNASAAAEMLLLNRIFFSKKRTIVLLNYFFRIKRSDYLDAERLFKAISRGPAYDIPRSQSLPLLWNLFDEIYARRNVDSNVLFECMDLLENDFQKLDELKP